MHPMLKIAIRAAHNAGDLIQRSVDRVDSLDVTAKAKNDFATEVDRAAEREIMHVIHKAYPAHGFVAEESGVHEGNDYVWVIDPLDGTTNFIHGFPQFAVSIALRHKGKYEVGVVYDPMRAELFTASRGDWAMLNNRRIRVTKRKNLHGALLGTGFPFKAQQHLETYLEMFKAMFPDSAGIRRPGSAALDLAYVACGRLDGFWEIGLSEWDMAAGLLLIQEAGGIATDFEGKDDFVRSGNILTANPKLHELMKETIEPCLTDGLRSRA